MAKYSTTIDIMEDGATYNVILNRWTATFNISTNSSLFYGQVITIAKDGSTIGTVSLDNLGQAVYEAHETGVYTFTLTYQGTPYIQTSTISTEADTTIAVNLNPWTATLSLYTSESSFVGDTVTVTKGGVTVGTAIVGNDGYAYYLAHEAGTYVMTLTHSEKEDYSIELTATTDGGTYSDSITRFASDITLTTTSTEFYSHEITVQYTPVGGTAIVYPATQFDATGSVVYDVHKAGSYRFTVTYVPGSGAATEVYDECVIQIADSGESKSGTINRLTFVMNVSTASTEFTGETLTVYKDNVQIDTLTLPATVDTSVVYTVHHKGTYKFALTYQSTEYSDSVVVNDSGTKNLNISLIIFKIFAVHYSENDSDPDSCTYPEGYDNYGWTPFSMNLSTGVPNYGSWNPSGDNADLVKFIFPRSCMLKYDGTVDYYLNENDETKKEDGTASDVANTSYGGNAMMEWGQDGIIYWKILPDSDNKGWTFIVSNAQKDKDGNPDPDMRPWNHYDCNGNVAAHWYTAKYFGSNINNKVRSISGQSNYVNEDDAAETTKCRANNLTSDIIWDKEVYADWMFIALMCVLLGKSLNTQAKFGYGRCKSSNTSAIGQGTMNGKGMFYGVSNQTSGVKVFGMENYLWGNLCRRIRGLINVSGTVKVKMTHGTQDGTTVSDYNQTGSGYLTVGSIGGTSGGYTSGGGYISAMNITKYGLTPKTISGSDSTYYTDKGFFNNIQTDIAFVCGDWNLAFSIGAFCCYMGNVASFADTSHGAALSCKPLA